ncbi:MAG: hypothetical protein LCH37_11955 [Bacteroidetes bacterium]|nr:hypothetical protein [Bacteroidota bacterium]
MELIPLLVLHPPISGYYAKSKGHSFWLWFTLGFFLPVISNIILYFLKDRPLQPVEQIVQQHQDKVLFSVNPEGLPGRNN